MSIASGRMWSQLGTSIDQIGRMALLREQQRKEEERQAAQDQLAAQDRALRMAEVTSRTGIQFIPEGQDIPTIGTAAPQTGKNLLPMAIPTARAPSTLSAPAQALQAERMGLPNTPPPAAATKPVALTAIARAIQGQQPTTQTSGVGTVVGTAPGGRYVQTRMSDDQREEATKLKEAERNADALAVQNDEFRALPRQERMEIAGNTARFNAFTAQTGRDEAASARQATAERAAAEARAHIAAPYWGNRPKNLGVEATNTIGRQLAARNGAGGGNGSGPAGATPPGRLTSSQAQDRLKIWRPQYDNAQQDLGTARGNVPKLETQRSSIVEQPDTAAARRAWRADSAFVYDELKERTATRDSLGNLISQASRDAVTVPASYLLPPRPAVPDTAPAAPRTAPPAVAPAAPEAPTSRAPARSGFDLAGAGRGAARRKVPVSQQEWDDLVEMYDLPTVEQNYTIIGRP